MVRLPDVECTAGLIRGRPVLALESPPRSHSSHFYAYLQFPAYLRFVCQIYEQFILYRRFRRVRVVRAIWRNYSCGVYSSRTRTRNFLRMSTRESKREKAREVVDILDEISELLVSTMKLAQDAAEND